jgi:hypothetical protein
MDSLNTSFSRLLEDPELSSYFIDNNIDLYQFLQRYSRVDKILSVSPNISPDILADQLKQLQLSVNKHSDILSSLKDSFHLSLKDSLNDSLSSSNIQIKSLLDDYLSSLKDISNPSSLYSLLNNFHDKLLHLNTEQLNDIDRKSLFTLSNFQSNLLKDISTTLDSHTIHHKISNIHDTLTSLHNNFTGNSSLKGQMTENLLHHVLLKAFPDSDVLLTRHQHDSCDIQIKRDGKPTILIDSKHCEASNVRKSDLDKFYDDCKLNNSSGILCNAFGGIANRKHLEIDIHDNRVLVFLSNHQFDPHLFLLASRIIYNLSDIISPKLNNHILLDQQLFQRLKIEYNFFLQSFHLHLDNIKANVNSLSQLSLHHLDQFFKRSSSVSNSLKPFSCPQCATGFSSSKALNSHLKNKHKNPTDSLNAS